MILILFLIGTRWCTTSFEINKLQHQGYVLASYCFLKEIGKNHINKCKDPLRILIIFPLNSHSKEHQAEVACSVFLISQRMIRKWISFWMCKCEKIVTFSSLLSKRCNFVAVGDYWLVGRFRLSVVNTKPKLSQDPIRRWENNCKNRWELEVNSKRSKRGKTRVTKSWLALVLHMIGWESGASSFGPITERRKAKPMQPGVFSTLSCKLL